MTVEAVIFDWGGTLTPWVTQDGRGWWRIAAALVPPDDVQRVGALLTAAEEEIWRRSRDEHASGTMLEILTAAGITDHAAAHDAHALEWDPATYLDPQVPDLFAGLRERGIRVGVLSNTVWSRERHDEIFVRDGVHHLLDGTVYTSEIPWTKPHPEAFWAAMRATGVSEPAHCVFVGDRPFDDIFGARQAGMRAVLLPHSDIPDVQRGHTQVDPDAVIACLADLIDVVDGWR